MKNDSYANTKWFVGVGLTMLVVGFVVIPTVYFPQHRQVNRVLKPTTKLRNLAQGLSVYAKNNQDQFPPNDIWQEVLVQHGIVEVEYFQSEIDQEDNYFLVARQLTFDQDEILVYENPNHHTEGVLVAFSDIRVEYVAFEEFERMLATQLTEQEASTETP